MPACDDIKVGGTVGAASITGGRSIADYAVTVVDYSSLWGTVAKRAGTQAVIGQPGRVITGKGLPEQRLLTLGLMATDLPAAGGIGTSADLWANQDDLTSLFTASGGEVLEWVHPDGSRYVQAHALVASPVIIFQKLRRLALPLMSPWPYWRSDTEETQEVDGAAVAIAALGGTVERIYDPKLVFAGDGSFTDDESGLVMTVAGSGASVTVQRDSLTGRWTAIEGGNPVPGKVSVDDTRWMFLTVGGTFTSTVSVDVTWRDQWE